MPLLTPCSQPDGDGNINHPDILCVTAECRRTGAPRASARSFAPGRDESRGSCGTSQGLPEKVKEGEKNLACINAPHLGSARSRHWPQASTAGPGGPELGQSYLLTVFSPGSVVS